MSANCMRAKILPAALFAALTLTAITSVRADEATFEVTWLGKNNKSWTDSEVWDTATPEAWQTAIINSSSLIKFKAGNGETVVSNVVVGANVSPTFQRADSAPDRYGQHLLVQEMNGAGTLKLNRVGIHANYSNYDTCNISVAKIEAVANGNYDSWFDGGSASGKRMVVNSDITVNGFLKVYKQTTLAGETTLAGKLLMVDEAVVVNNLVYAGDDATIDSASKGSVGRLTVRSGTLSYSALPTGVTLGSLVLDGGTLSVASDFSGTIAVAEGGGTLFLEGEWTDADSVSLPAGLSFAEGADLSKVTVQATIGESTRHAIFAIVNDNEAYSLKYVAFNLDELDLADGSLATSIASAKVAKGVLLITAGTPILGSAEIGEHGAIAVDVSGLVTTTTSTTEGDNRIDLFSAASLTLPEGESLSDVIVLTGPSCEYTLHSEVQGEITKVYAKITDVANAGISRKVTVWKAGEGWNNESGNWSNGAPGDESEDIGVFCGDAQLNFHNEKSEWVVTYAQMHVRGATVKLFANMHSAPNITFRKITGKGRLEALGINLMPLDTLTVGAGIETVTGAGNNDFYPTISVGNGVTFDGPIVIGEYTTINVVGYEDEVVPTGGSINFPANMKFAEGVTSATVAVAGHSDLTVSLVTDENGKIAASVVASIVKWVGGASDSKWGTAANWEGGSVPTEETTVWFDASADVGLNVATAARVFVAEGAVVKFYSTDPHSWPKRSLAVKSMSGGGKVQLSNVRLMANGDDNAFTNIKVAELELLQEQRWDGAGNVDYPGSILESTSTKWLRICSDISGEGGLECTPFTMHFCGDNSNYTGYASFNSGNGDNQTNRHFEKPESLFGNAQEFKFVGKMFLDFTEGTGKLGNVNFGESWGATFETKPNANVTLEVEGGSICDTWFGDGFEVNGGGTLTIKKVGEGTLVYGVTKAHNLVVAEGRVEFTGENNNGDDADVNVTVKAGASIGSSEAFSHENPNWTLGGDVTHRGTFTFDDEESVAKVYVEAGDATEPAASAKRTLTLNKDGNNKAFTTMVTVNPALNEWLGGDAAEREAKLNTPNSHGINGIQAYMIGYPTFTDDTVPSLAVGVSEDIFSFNFDIGKSSAREVDGLAVNYSLKSSSDMVNWTNVGSATVSGGAVAASAEALSTGGPYVKLCAEVVPTK